MPKKEPSEFDGCEPLEGLEHLGRAIVDAAGIPSGSPANFENLRGKSGNPDAPSREEVVARIKKEFGSKPNG